MDHLDATATAQVEALDSSGPQISLRELGNGDVVVFTFAREPQAKNNARLQILVTATASKEDKYPYIRGIANDNRDKMVKREVLLSGMRAYGSLQQLGTIAVGSQPVIEYFLNENEIRTEMESLRAEVLSGVWPRYIVSQDDFNRGLKERGISTEFLSVQDLWRYLKEEFPEDVLVGVRRTLSTPIATKIEIVKVRENSVSR